MNARLAAALVVVTLAVGVPMEAHASGWDSCFDDGTQVALCNGIIAGIGGALGAGLMGYTLLDSEPVETGEVAAGVALGIYAGVSGGILVAMHEDMPADAPLRDTALGLGIANLGLGGASLVLSALAGLRSAFDDIPEEEDDDHARWSVSPTAPGAAAGLSLTARF